ncbi:MAG: NAD(P)-dependent oxidoreductase, partial [Pseudomonadota bacterium]
QVLAARGAEAGWTFLDAPVSGGPAGARGGTMTMLLGGDEATAGRLAPLLDRLAAKRVHVGGPGAGHAAKIANNMLCAANLALVAEALRLGEAAGVPAEKLLEGVNAGSGRSAVSEVNFPRWILSGAYDSGFTMGLMRKDVRLAEALGEASATPLPAFEGVARVWADSAARLPDDADFNEIARPGKGPGGETKP